MANLLELNCLKAFKGKECVFLYCSKLDCECVSNKLLEKLATIDSRVVIKEMFQFLDSRMDFSIQSFDVIQYSTLEKCGIPLLEHLEYSKNIGFSFREVGAFLQGKDHNLSALVKYGENHSKLAEILGLVEINRSQKPYKVFVSRLGSEILKIRAEKTNRIIANLALRAKIIQYILYKSSKGSVCIENELSFLEKSTFSRRITNIKGLLEFIYNNSETNLDYLYKDVCYKYEP